MRKLSLVGSHETERKKTRSVKKEGTETTFQERVQWAKELLAVDRPLQVSVLQRIYSELLAVKNAAPELFAGDDVYLWEQLAFAFHYHAQIKQAERCLRIQAELQPDKSDAFLNLGVFLTDAGYYDAALAAYQEGLQRTPHCEFLNYNLATLASFLGRHDLAPASSWSACTI